VKGCTRKIGPFDCCTVILGNCEKYLKQIPPGAIDLVVTDPPYGMKYRSSNREKHGPIHGDDRPYPATTLKQLIEIPRLASYFFCRWDNLWHHDAALTKPTSALVWLKPRGGMGGKHGHRRVYEMALFYPRIGQHKLFRGGRPSDVMEAGRSGNLLHATQKPEELIMEMLEWYNFETVLDPYMGSGMTGRAAKMLKKHFLGFEIDKKNHATAVSVIEKALPRKRVAPTELLQPELGF
jgi:site-specific DNA-methyltransferase (adenine-specific)